MGDRMRITGPEESTAPVVAADAAKTKKDKRRKERKASEARKIFIQAGAVSQARGSAYIEIGRTKVMVSVYGPRETERSAAYSDQGLLECEFKFAPFASPCRRPNQPTDEEQSIAEFLTSALRPAIRLEMYPKSVVEVFALVLEDDGSAAAAAITAASVAIADAGIEMFDLVAACSLAYNGKKLYLDPTLDEEGSMEGHTTLSCMSSLQEVSALLQRGEVPFSKQAEHLEAAIAACSSVYKVQRHSLLAKK